MQNQFSNKKIYGNSSPECPLCSSKAIKKQYIIKRYDPPFKIDRCGACGFMFINPPFNDKVIKNLYREEYYKGSAEYSYYDERDAERYSRYVWEKRVKVIRRYADSGNFLDIGCAFGGLLRAASEYYAPFGIEFSNYSAGYARSLFGKNIHTGTIEDHGFKHDFFSVITMIELIEHLKDPAHAVNECYKLLKEGGLLLIQTANMDGLQAKILKDNYAYFMPGHMSYFTKSNLEHLLKKAGFRRVKIYYPVEFGLLPKLLKSRYSFKSYIDYYKWLKIAYYHFISKIRFGNFAATSSMVVYAVK